MTNKKSVKNKIGDVHRGRALFKSVDGLVAEIPIQNNHKVSNSWLTKALPVKNWNLGKCIQNLNQKRTYARKYNM